MHRAMLHLRGSRRHARRLFATLPGQGTSGAAKGSPSSMSTPTQQQASSAPKASTTASTSSTPPGGASGAPAAAPGAGSKPIPLSSSTSAGSSGAGSSGAGSSGAGSSGAGSSGAGSSGAGSRGVGSGGSGSGFFKAAALLMLPAGAYYAYQYNLQSQTQGRRTKGEDDAMLTHNDADDFVVEPQGQQQSNTRVDRTGFEGSSTGDDYSAAADEFPGALEGRRSAAAAAAAAGSDQRHQSEAADQAPTVEVIDLSSLTTPVTLGDAANDSGDASDTVPVVQIDATPIDELLSEVYRGAMQGGSSSSSTDLNGVTGSSTAADDQLETEEERKAAARIVAAMDAAAAAAAAAQPVAVEVRVEDLTPSGLVAAAAASGYGPKDDWVAAAAQLRQATADAETMGRMVQALLSKQHELEAALETERQERAAIEEAAARKAAAITSRFHEVMEHHQRVTEEMTAAAVRAAEERVAVDSAKNQTAERVERIKALDGVREQVNVLSTAFSRRSREAQAGTEAHRTALGALALATALEEGRPVAKELGALESSCPSDPVLSAVVDSLPPAAKGKGVPARSQLEERFEQVARAMLQLSYFPPGSGGVLAHALARGAAALKVDVGADGGDGVQSQISKARTLLKDGRVLAAAEALSAAAAGSEAAAAVEGWVEDARARAMADQNAKLLQAHAMSAAAAMA